MPHQDPFEQDVPYGEDLQSADGALAWAIAADQKRPWRSTFRELIAEQVAALRRPRVLELGSGPGALAQCVLERCADIAEYLLVDFSEPMLAMSRDRVAGFPATRFLLADFRSEVWLADIGPPFDCVLAMQSVHEVRHKRHVPQLYRRIRRIAAPSATVLICDHTPRDAHWPAAALFMTEPEQLEALAEAGFVAPAVLKSENGLVLYHCTIAAEEPSHNASN